MKPCAQCLHRICALPSWHRVSMYNWYRSVMTCYTATVCKMRPIWIDVMRECSLFSIVTWSTDRAFQWVAEVIRSDTSLQFQFVFHVFNFDPLRFYAIFIIVTYGRWLGLVELRWKYSFICINVKVFWLDQIRSDCVFGNLKLCSNLFVNIFRCQRWLNHDCIEYACFDVLRVFLPIVLLQGHELLRLFLFDFEDASLLLWWNRLFPVHFMEELFWCDCVVLTHGELPHQWLALSLNRVLQCKVTIVLLDVSFVHFVDSFWDILCLLDIFDIS